MMVSTYLLFIGPHAHDITLVEKDHCSIRRQVLGRRLVQAMRVIMAVNNGSITILPLFSANRRERK